MRSILNKNPAALFLAAVALVFLIGTGTSYTVKAQENGQLMINEQGQVTISGTVTFITNDSLTVFSGGEEFTVTMDKIDNAAEVTDLLGQGDEIVVTGQAVDSASVRTEIAATQIRKAPPEPAPDVVQEFEVED